MKSTKIETRPYQSRIIDQTLRLFTSSKATSILIESPTGSGKTVMGLSICAELQRRFGYSIGWSAMRRNLLTQAEREVMDKGFAIDGFRTISMFDKSPPQVDVLVVDEAQHDATASMAMIYGKIKPKFILGLTATPYRSDRMGLCFEKIIKDCGIHQLIQDGFLSQYHHYTIESYTPESIAATYLMDREKWGKSVMFFRQIEQCLVAYKLLNDQGVKVEVVTANSDRERQLGDFESGKCEVLINMMILTEGFDSPNLKTVFIRPSIKGCTVQMGGRVFRNAAGMPYKQIVQCLHTKYPFPRHASPQEQYVLEGGLWRSLKMNKQLDNIANQSIKHIIKIDVEIPEFIAHRSNRKRRFFNDSDE